MGLNIMYYGNLKRLKNQGWPKRYSVYVTNTKAFKDRCTKFKNGYYNADVLGAFRAGSYIGYNSWRNQLCILANNIPAEMLWEANDSSLFFYELIDFTDHRGTLDYKVCGQLLADFVAFNEKAKTFNLEENNVSWFFEAYALWYEAMRAVVEKNGVISFV